MKDNFWTHYWQNIHQVSGESAQISVARTRGGSVISHEDWERTLEHLQHVLKHPVQQKILDACGGNGMVANYFADLNNELTLLDINKALLESSPVNSKINKIHSGLLEYLEECQETFDVVILYAGIQYFSYSEIIKIFKLVTGVLCEGGLFLIGDILDVDKKVHFLKGSGKIEEYFLSELNDRPLMGTWLKLDWLLLLSEWSGFSKAKLVPQPEYQIYSDFRFDVLITK